MRRAAHRGGYEQLWSEQKFAVLAISSKRFISGCRRLNQKAPRVLSFLDQLSGLPSTPQGEPANAFLTVYGLVKRHLERSRRRELVELLVGDPRAACDQLFLDIVRYRESGLYGCRLFYPFEASFKYWDLQEQTGLWVLLGPWFLHLGLPAVRRRVEAGAGISAAEFDERLARLASGIDRGEYEAWPAALRLALQRHNLVALPGYKTFLHPRAAEHLPFPAADVQDEDPESAVLLGLERYWDEHPQDMPLLPESDDWLRLTGSDPVAAGMRFTGPLDPENHISALREEFDRQAAAEGRTPGRGGEAAEEPEEGEDDGSGIGFDDGDRDEEDEEYC